MAVNISTCMNISIIFTLVKGCYPQYDRNNAFPNLAVAQNHHHFCSVTNEFMTMVIHTGFPQIPPSKILCGTTNCRTFSMCMYPDIVATALIQEPIVGKNNEKSFIMLSLFQVLLM